MKLLISLPLLFLVAACSPYASGLQGLGSQSSFNDVSIPDDFSAPEDEVVDNVSGDVEMTPGPVQVNLKNTFFLEDRVFSLARGPALRWDGCESDKESQGGYNSDT